MVAAPLLPDENPYTERLSSYDERFFCGRAADLRLLETGLKSPPTKSFALVGGPKIGKTALLLKFRANHLHAAAERRRPTPLVYVDCHRRSTDDILFHIAAELVAQLGLEAGHSGEFEELQQLVARPRLGDSLSGDEATDLRRLLVRTIRALDRSGVQPILCLNHFGRLDPDEAAVSLSLRELSACASFVIALEPDKLETVQRNSPFVNTIFVRRIGLMPYREAAELINAPFPPDEGWGSEEARAIYWIAGGNPYLLTLVCEELFNQKLRGSSVLTAQLQRRDERIVKDVETLPAIRGLFVPVWANLSPAAREILALAAHAPEAHPADPTVVPDQYRDSQAAGELRDWGLLDTDSASGNLVLCSRLFVRFVRSQEPPSAVASPAAEIAQELDVIERGLRGSNEGQLLRLLRDRSGSVVSVDDMRRTIWKDSPEGDRHVVDQTLSRLRKRLREQLPGHDELIRGVRGQGYSLVLPGREPPRRT
jgi:hypothetical protein